MEGLGEMQSALESTVEVAAMPEAATRGTVLLVEDDRAVRRYMEVLLQKEGFAVIPAADGLEAMKLSLSARFDVVITDAIMPQLNGYELCRFFRRHPRFMQVPVVLLSGMEQNGAFKDETAMPDAFLSKPVNPEQLSACLAKLVGK